jgi:hypothetical protein
MRRFIQLTALALALGLAGPLLSAPIPALAHEHRDVAGGKYDFTVGFINEPALQNEPNGIDLTITDKATQQPVEGAEKTLKATIAFGGGQPKEFPLRARFRMPGKYTADVIPTRNGSYVFTFNGTVNGDQVNEKFESGPGRFNDVQSSADLQFPVANPAPADLQAQLAEARQQAASANTMALAGVGLGILALLAAAFAIFSRRPTASRAGSMATEGSRAS